MTSRRGSMGLYTLLFALVSLVLIIVFFFPQFFRMQSGIYRLSCREIRAKIQVAVEAWKINNTRSIVQPDKPIDLDMLKANGYLMDVQYCPEKGTYKYGPQGEVLCTLHRPKPTDEEAPKGATPEAR